MLRYVTSIKGCTNWFCATTTTTTTTIIIIIIILCQTYEASGGYGAACASNCAGSADEVIIAEKLDNDKWHKLEMTLKSNPDSYGDKWTYAVDSGYG